MEVQPFIALGGHSCNKPGSISLIQSHLIDEPAILNKAERGEGNKRICACQ